MILGLAEFGFAAAMGGALVSYLVWSAKRQQAFLQNLIETHLRRNTDAVDKLTLGIERMTVSASEAAKAAAVAAQSAQLSATTMQAWFNRHNGG